jgi:hypothetical protein
MFSKPQAEHAWLQQLVGNWTFEHDCQMPDGSKNKSSGKMTCRSMAGMWLLCESTGGAGDEAWSSLMTVGYDPTKEQYVGSFIGSMMHKMWLYHGTLAEDQKRLPLISEGPKLDDSGTCRYRDTIEIVDKDTWNFLSEVETDTGEWVQFMAGRHVRA